MTHSDSSLPSAPPESDICPHCGEYRDESEPVANMKSGDSPKFCPTCEHDGSEQSPYDANCPAAWAHQYLRPFGWLEMPSRAASPSIQSSPQASEITEAIESFEKAARRANSREAPRGEAVLAAARSRLEILYREQQQEIEALDRVKGGYFEELVGLRAAFSSLKEDALRLDWLEEQEWLHAFDDFSENGFRTRLSLSSKVTNRIRDTIDELRRLSQSRVTKVDSEELSGRSTESGVPK